MTFFQPEKFDEKSLYGRPMFMDLRPKSSPKAPLGTSLSCQNWDIEAAYRMLQNNLDPRVAIDWEKLIVYGGSGRAARNWKEYWRILETLKRLKPDETLCVQSGKPVYIGKTHQAIESSDIVMLASGTATLESMLIYKPMIVAYKMSWLTYLIVKLLAKLPYASIPNILANDCIVPECLQYRCTPKILASELDKFLNSTKNIKKIISYYEKFSKKLRKQADYGAANAVLQLIENDKLN